MPDSQTHVDQTATISLGPRCAAAQTGCDQSVTVFGWDRGWQALQVADSKQPLINEICLRTRGSWVQILPGAPNSQGLAKSQALFICAPGRAHLLGGVSPLHTRHGEVLAEGKGVLGDWESEGSRRQSAGATNRKRIEAALWDERSKVREVRYVYGTRRRRSDAHKREGGCAIPGEI